MKPIIGITLDIFPSVDSDPKLGPFLKLRTNYTEMIYDAGGIPLVIPPIVSPREIAHLLDGWLIPGGDDIDAKHFGQENHPRAALQNPRRFEYESELFESAPSEMPIFGICYGCQFLNVKLGGTLDQHIPDDPTKGQHSGGVSQDYRIEDQTKLAEILSETSGVGPSYHHQAIDRVAPTLRVNAHASDGTIEGVEGTGDRWLIGVQWHPERAPNSETTKRLFQEFVAAARQFKENKSNAISSQR